MGASRIQRAPAAPRSMLLLALAELLPSPAEP